MDDLAELLIKFFAWGLNFIGNLIIILTFIYGFIILFSVLKEADFFGSVVCILAFSFVSAPIIAILILICRCNRG